MVRLTLRQLAAKKFRLLTTALAVLLGVAFLAGTLILTDTIGRTLDGVLADANAGTDAYVRGTSELDLGFGESRPRLDAAMINEIRTVDGVAEAAARITGYAQILDKDGEPVGDPTRTPTFGLNWVTVPELNAYQITDGRPPADDGEIVIDRGSAETTGFVPGDRTTVLSSGAPRSFTIVGIAGFGGADSPGGATTVLFTDTTAQQLFGEAGHIDGIAVTAAPGISQTDLVAAIEPTLAGAAEVITGDALTLEDQGAVADNLRFFNVFMLVFALVAVFVGAFIINNTFSITVAQRTREMAMFRAIGADRRQVLAAVLTEALAVAAIASAAGLACGIAVARGLQALLAAFGFDMPDGPTVVSARTVVVSVAVGVVVTVGSAYLPARRAARVAPVAALRETAFEPTVPSRRRLLSGMALTGAGVATLLVGLSAVEVRLVGLGAVAVFVGVSVLGPILARPFSRAIGAPLPVLRGVAGALARQNAMRNPKRTARTAASLMIGVGLVGFITILAASTRTSIAGSLDRDYRGTHVVESGAFNARSGLSPDLAAALRSLPAVDAISEARVAQAEVDGRERAAFFAFDPQGIGALFDLGELRGDLASLAADGIAVSEEEAAVRGWDLGDTVTVRFVTGAQTMIVRAIYDNAEEWVGAEFVGIAAFDANLPNQLDARIYLATTDPSAVEQATAAYPSADLLDKAGFLDSRNAEINTLLALIYVMLALAVVIALLGIANTLALSIFERTRELGLLRAIGMDKRQVRAAVRWEAALIALFGTTLGLAVGVFFGWAMVRALADEGVNQLTIPVASLALIIVIAALAGIGAAIMPARRAARLNILDALATT